MSSQIKISEAASLALHAMTFLASQDAGKAFSCREIAALLGVSEAHLGKVMQRLVHQGLLKSTRGAKGGFTLARGGDQITLLEVYEAVEGPMTKVGCLLGTMVCGGNDCILRNLIGDINVKIRDYFSGTKLTDLKGVYAGIELD